MLIAGGDTGGKLGGIINLATTTVSSASAQIFDTTTNTFVAVGSLNTSRESALGIALPNGKTLIVGGETCAAATFGGTSGFQCTALQTAELYNENTKAFTIAGSGSGNLMTIARSGPSVTLISGSGTGLDGQVLIVGGSTGSSFLSTSPPPPGSGAPPGQQALHTAELYNPANDSFTATTNAIPACPAGTFPPGCTTGLASVCPGATSAISSASDSSGVVTITMTTANPTGLLMGSGVTIANVSVAGYNGSFTVTAIPSANTFQYMAASGLAAGTGGTAAADTFECGMVDQGAALLANGKVLLAGGDILQFLGESSNTAFLFDPSTQTFTRTGSMASPRELFPLVALDSGGLSGHVVAFGGIDANSAVCLPTPATPVVATTLGVAEIYDPNAGTWSAVADASSPITSTSESVNTVTVTSASNPTGLVMGSGVTIAGVSVAGYNGSFIVTAIPTGTTFQYMVPATALAAGTGGTAQANTMGVRRTTQATLFKAGSLAGEVILPGGVDVEAGTFPNTCTGVTGIKQGAIAETDLFDPNTGTVGTITPTGSLNAAREGQAQGVLGSGTDMTDVLAAGGACTTPAPSLQSVVIGTTQATTTCGNAKFTSDYSELFSQSTHMWTVGPTFASAPTNAAAFAILP